MMIEAGLSLQIACQQRLLGDTTIIQRLGNNRIFDVVPRHQTMPYVTIRVERAADWSTSTETGASYVIVARIWSDYEGRREVDQIGDAVETALLQAPLNLTNYRVINLRMQTAQTGQEPDGRSFLSVLTFRAVVEPR